jgi:hypothetical protein
MKNKHIGLLNVIWTPIQRSFIWVMIDLLNFFHMGKYFKFLKNDIQLILNVLKVTHTSAL